jgi:hypothetical protein
LKILNGNDFSFNNDWVLSNQFLEGLFEKPKKKILEIRTILKPNFRTFLGRGMRTLLGPEVRAEAGSSAEDELSRIGSFSRSLLPLRAGAGEVLGRRALERRRGHAVGHAHVLFGQRQGVDAADPAWGQCYKIRSRLGWATIWAIFSQTHLVTLQPTQDLFTREQRKSGADIKK